MPRKLLLIGAIVLMCLRSGFGQNPIHQSNNRTYFEKAMDLFHAEKYAAAQRLFWEYAHSIDDELRKADARHYASICAAELLLENTVEKALSYQSVHGEHAKMPRSQFSLGTYFFREKSYRNALNQFIEFEPILSLYPEEAESYYFMTGYCQFVEGNYKEARSYFDEIIDYQNEYYHLANYFHAYVSFEIGEYERALKGFKRIDKHENFQDFVPLYIAEVYAYNKQYDEVIRYGDSILQNSKLQKKHIVHLLLAQAYFKKNDYANSIKFYEKFNDLRKLSTEDSYQFGYAYYQKEDYKKCLKPFSSIILEQDSFGQNVTYLMADAHVKNGDKEQSRNAFLLAANMDFDPKIKEISTFNYAKLSHELKFNKVAMTGFSDFIKNYPRSKYLEESKVNLTRLLLSSSNHLKALELIDEIPDPNKKIQEAYQRLAFNVGLEYLDIKNYENSRVYFNKSLEKGIDPVTNALCFFWIGESLYSQERYEESVTSYRNFFAVPESKEVTLFAIGHYNLGYSYIKTKAYKDALYHFDEYFKNGNKVYTDQFNSDAHLRMADCYFELRVYKNAIESYQLALDKEAEMDYCMFQIGLIKGLQGRPNDKIEWLENMVRKYPYSQYADDAIFEKANEKFILGNKSQAQREFEYLNQDFPNNPYFTIAQQKLGLIFYQLDQPEKAILIFKDIIKAFPSTKESKESLRILKDIYTDWGKADQYFNWLANLDSNYTIRASEKDSAIFESALSFLKKGDCKQGVDVLSKYLEEFPKGIHSMEALFYKAECSNELGNLMNALSAFDELIARAPNKYSNEASEKATALTFAADSFRLAIPYLELRTQLVNNNTELMKVYEALAKCHLELGNCGNAEKYLTKIKAFDGAEKEVIQQADYTLARCAMAKEHYTMAIQVFSSIAKENENRLGAECQYLTAYLYYMKESYDSCETAILGLRDNFPSQDYFLSKSFILLADLYIKNDQLDDASAILEIIKTNAEEADILETVESRMAYILEMKEMKRIELEQIHHEETDTIEYNEK